jgi:integrase
MASLRQTKSGWRAEVFRRGIRRSKTFPSKQEAKDWAARTEWEILNRKALDAKLSLGDVFDRYAREVSPTKRGARWEQIRLERFQRDPIAKVKLPDLTPDLFGRWRDKRLREVSPGTVIRELQIMSAVMTAARREWGLIDANPLSDVRKPAKPPARDRLPTADEVERMAFVAGDDLSKATARAFHAFRFAMETAMRAGEICHLTRANTDLGRRVARLEMTKNGRPRDVPLSSAAVALIEALPEADPVFGLDSRQLDALFRKVRDRAGVTGLTFHDSRAAAIVALSKKVDVLTLARIVGHTDIKMLMVYYREDAASIAGRLG